MDIISAALLLLMDLDTSTNRPKQEQRARRSSAVQLIDTSLKLKNKVQCV